MKAALGVALLVFGTLFLSFGEYARTRKGLFFDLWKLDHWNYLKFCQGEPEWVE